MKILSESSRAKIQIGPAGWSYQDWRGVVYPTPRPRGFHEASYLAHYFPVIEINTSFYRPPRPELSRLWVKRIEGIPRFQFTAKLYHVFTHERILNRDDVRVFKDGIEPLLEAGRLGAVLMQFPWSFRATQENQQYLQRLRKAFRQDFHFDPGTATVYTHAARIPRLSALNPAHQLRRQAPKPVRPLTDVDGTG